MTDFQGTKTIGHATLVDPLEGRTNVTLTADPTRPDQPDPTYRHCDFSDNLVRSKSSFLVLSKVIWFNWTMLTILTMLKILGRKKEKFAAQKLTLEHECKGLNERLSETRALIEGMR